MNLLKSPQLNDEQYVEWIRKRDGNVRRFWWVWPVLFVGFVLVAVYFGSVVHRLVKSMASYSTADERLLYLTIANGFMFGLCFFIIAFQTVLCIRWWRLGRRGNRAERLMLKYHDELQTQEGSNKELKATR